MKPSDSDFSSGPGCCPRRPTGRPRIFLLQLSWLLLAAVVMTSWGEMVPSALAGKDQLPGEIVRLHPALDERLDASTAARYSLFMDVPGLQEVTFLKAPWGGYLVRLKIATDTGTVWRERNVETQTWREWQLRVVRVQAGRSWQDDADPAVSTGSVLAGDPSSGDPAVASAPAGAGTQAEVSSAGRSFPGEDLSGATELSSERIRVWPEVPLPPITAREIESRAISDYQNMNGRWFVLLEAGVRHNVTDFNHFFTDMGMIAMNWGVMLGRLMPFMSMEVGFGDLRDDFEELAGDGRSNTYGFSLGMLARQPLSKRQQFYVSGAFGYFIRSLQWGGTFLNQNTGAITDGLVLEQQNWGWSFRAGFMFNRKHTTKSRFWDIGVGLQTTPAEEWHYFDDASNFFATERDMWVTLSIRFGDSI